MKKAWIVGAAVACVALAACSSSGGSKSPATSGGAQSSVSTPTSASSSDTPTSTSSSPTGPPTGTPYVLGQIGSFTGPLAESFAQKKDALTAWADWTNDNGGINGHPVKLVQVDDQGDPAKSIAGVKTLVQNDKVLAIVDSSFVDTAWQKYIEQQKMPVVGDALYQDAVFGAKGSDYFFPEGTTNAELIYGMMAGAVQLGHKKLGILCMTVVPACQLIPKFMTSNAPKAGGTVVYSAGLDPASPNFTAQCIGAKNAGAEAVYVAAVPALRAKVLSDCAKQGTKFVYMSTHFATNVSDATNPAFNGTVVSSPSVPLVSDSPAAQDFLNAMKKYAPGVKDIDGNGQISWQSGLLFGAAAKAGNLGDNPTREMVLTGLYSLKNETLGGAAPPLTYTQGQAHRIPCYFVYEIKDGAFVAPQGLTPQCAPAGVAAD